LASTHGKVNGAIQVVILLKDELAVVRGLADRVADADRWQEEAEG
jgi:hypothetical protein